MAHPSLSPLGGIYRLSVVGEGHRRHLRRNAAEQVAPLVITTLAVTLLKVAVIPLAVFLLKRIFGRERSKKSVHR